MYEFKREEYEKRITWFKEARFGLFIHWGLYAIPSRGEWLRSDERVKAEDYEHYMDDFTAERCDPREWVRLAKQAGMRYAVLTTKQRARNPSRGCAYHRHRQEEDKRCQAAFDRYGRPHRQPLHLQRLP